MHAAIAPSDYVGGEEGLAYFFKGPVFDLGSLGVCGLGVEGEPHGLGQAILGFVEGGETEVEGGGVVGEDEFEEDGLGRGDSGSFGLRGLGLWVDG